ncbi:MAG: FdhF/YdeP family oxidoreductase [Bryobacteraceae bacterium]|nr:FdhF/YdeP family oxidoreductase [Bryobacteraceae bacterium]
MKQKPPAKAAAGVPAIVKTIETSWKQMGVARSLETLRAVNQKAGFDCPGCAWPEPEEGRAAIEFCENGAKAVADEATIRQAGPEFFARWSVKELESQEDRWLNGQGRLVHPMVLRDGASHYEPIEWEDAFALIASELRQLDSPDQAIFYTSGRTSNEAAFLYQLFVRMFGTNNLPDCSNLCHESSGEALRQSIGVGKGTVTLDDFALADAIFVIGQNPGTNHPRMLATLQAAARRGCEIVSINPLPEAGLMRFRHPQEITNLLGGGTPLTTLYLPVRINGDVALLKGIMKEMLEEEDRRPGTVLDKEFIEQYTHGFSAFAEDVRRCDWADIVQQSGIERPLIRKAAEVAMRSQRTICCWAMGLTQHRNAVANIQEIVNLLLLRGNIGRPGAGVCPVRGHSNVQGDRTMGIWERMPDSFLDRLGEEFGFEPPRQHGFDTVRSIQAMLSGEARVFMALGGNFLSASPDTERTAAALRQCRLTVHVSTKLNRSHVVTGRQALILPCLGRTERDVQATGLQFVTVENSMGVISRSQGVLRPASEYLRSEIAIIAGIAAATLGVDWTSYTACYGRIRDHIARVVPGFEDFNKRIEERGSFLLPNAARDRRFLTATGKANFLPHPIPRHDLQSGELLMMTIRSHDQFNTTIYTDNDRYRGVFGSRRVILMNEEDMRQLNLTAGEEVNLVSVFQGEERVAPRFRVLPYPIPRQCTATYFPEANVLVPLGSVAERSNTPASKSVVIRLRKSSGS